MVIVADTSPVNYLILIGAIPVVPQLYGRLIVPAQVRGELLDPHTPQTVRAWITQAPSWLEVKTPNRIDLSHPLDEGELAAIALAQEMKADRLLIDEREGRELARQLGIPVAGTLAVLRDAANAGYIDLRNAIEQLKKTNFRASPRLYEQVLRGFKQKERH